MELVVLGGFKRSAQSPQGLYSQRRSWQNVTASFQIVILKPILFWWGLQTGRCRSSVTAGVKSLGGQVASLVLLPSSSITCGRRLWQEMLDFMLSGNTDCVANGTQLACISIGLCYYLKYNYCGGVSGWSWLQLLCLCLRRRGGRWVPLHSGVARRCRLGWTGLGAALSPGRCPWPQQRKRWKSLQPKADCDSVICFKRAWFGLLRPFSVSAVFRTETVCLQRGG